MFQFSFKFAFLSTSCLLNRTPKITRILTMYHANAPTLTPLGGGFIGHQFRRLFTKIQSSHWRQHQNKMISDFWSASQVLQEKARSTADWSAQHARFIFSLRDDNVITRFLRLSVLLSVTLRDTMPIDSAISCPKHAGDLFIYSVSQKKSPPWGYLIFVHFFTNA